MNQRSTLVLALLVSVAALATSAIGTWMALDAGGEGHSRVEAASDTDDAAAIAELRDQVARQSEALERLSMQLASIADQRRAAPGFDAPAAGGDRLTPTGGVAGSASGSSDGASDGPETDADLDARIAQLLAGELSSDQAWELMTNLIGSPRLDQLVEELSERAENAPDDPEAQFLEGMGFIAKLQAGANVMEMGVLAMKADSAFDRTLALDEDHLDARRTKAISLSFFPPIAGKRPEAISQFETVIEKQKQHPVEDGFAETYVLLGNLHLEGGDTEAAIAVLEDGLAAHPGDAQIQAQLDALAGANAGGGQ